MLGSVDAGSVAVALIGVVVGAVLGFAGSWLDAQLRRRRRGRSAARLIWLELMASRASIRGIRETGARQLLEVPLPAAVWEAERSAFAEVADAPALALVGLAYHELALAVRVLASSAKLAALPELPADSWLAPLDPYLKELFEHVELALAQLDRYSCLAEGPVDYSQLTSGGHA